jgi:hypothetical protein
VKNEEIVGLTKINGSSSPWSRYDSISGSGRALTCVQCCFPRQLHSTRKVSVNLDVQVHLSLVPTTFSLFSCEVSTAPAPALW